MKKNILLIGGVLFFGLIVWFVFQSKSTKQPVVERPAEKATDTISSTSKFTDPVSKESVTITFNQEGGSAILSGLSYTDLKLKSAVSASGTRYLDESGKVEVWLRGESMTISQNDKQVFAGNVGGQSDAEKLTGSVWVWQATTAGGKVIEPKDKTAFTLTFNSAEKTLNAATDCNNIFGPYTLGENNKLAFGDLGMTRKYCEGSQETDFAEGLGKVKSFSFNGAGALVLEFTTEGDSMLFGKKE